MERRKILSVLIMLLGAGMFVACFLTPDPHWWIIPDVAGFLTICAGLFLWPGTLWSVRRLLFG